MFKEFFKDLPDGAFWIKGADLKALGEMLDADRARLFEGTGTELPTPQGRFLLLNGAEGARYDQFQVLTRNKPDSDSGGFQWGVVGNSFLYESRIEDDYVDIGGLLADDLSTGWLDMKSSGDDKIWLEIVFGDWPSPTSYGIKSLGNNDSFGGGEIEYSSTTDGDGNTVYTQTFARLTLATGTVNDDGSLTFIQGPKGPRILMLGAETGYLSAGGSPQTVPSLFPYPK
jgi:hypothetical protein